MLRAPCADSSCPTRVSGVPRARGSGACRRACRQCIEQRHTCRSQLDLASVRLSSRERRELLPSAAIFLGPPAVSLGGIRTPNDVPQPQHHNAVTGGAGCSACIWLLGLWQSPNLSSAARQLPQRRDGACAAAETGRAQPAFAIRHRHPASSSLARTPGTTHLSPTERIGPLVRGSPQCIHPPRRRRMNGAGRASRLSADGNPPG